MKKKVLTCILNGYGKKNEQLNRVFNFGLNTYITLGFAEHGQFTNKKGIEKLSQSFLEDNLSRSVIQNGHQSTQFDLDNFQDKD